MEDQAKYKTKNTASAEQPALHSSEVQPCAEAFLLPELIKEFPEFCRTNRDKIKAAAIISSVQNAETKKFKDAFEQLFADMFDRHQDGIDALSDDHLRDYINLFPFYNGSSSAAVEQYMIRNKIPF